jgi:2-C-methyl-D-erythritol 4-phosphate cytidylyltransferase / 2-C-methyl-D-erythritol 2,4-cyclodiphosphate synthase
VAQRPEIGSDARVSNENLSTEAGPMTCAAIVVAGGAGLRADPTGQLPAKQYRMLAGRSVISRTLDGFLRHNAIDCVQVVLRKDSEASFRAVVDDHPKLLSPIFGGNERQDSVREALEALAGISPDTVLIHDAVRPFVSEAVIDRVVAALETYPAAIPAIPVTDTIKRVATGHMVAGTVNRDGLYAAQTPQGFRFSAIRAAHRKAAAARHELHRRRRGRGVGRS